MSRFFAGSVVLTVLFLVMQPCWGQQIIGQPVESGDLITPVNAMPLSIEDVARRRGIVLEKPAKNLVIFSCSGLSGTSAAIFDAVTQRRRDHVQWHGFQLVFPASLSGVKASDVDMVKAMMLRGNRLGLVSDNDFLIPGFVHGSGRNRGADLRQFNVALSFSNEKSVDARKAVLTGLNVAETPVAYDFKALEDLFRAKTSRFMACFYSPVSLMPAARQKDEPWMPELVSSLAGRLSLSQEGFCLIVHCGGVSDSRNRGQFSRMIEHMKLQETILRQLSVFAGGRNDTLLIVADEPENGYWKMSEEFNLDVFAGDLRKISSVVFETGSNSDKSENIIKRHFPEFAGINQNAGNQSESELVAVLEQKIAEKHQISFVSAENSGFNSGITVLAQGPNSEVFFGISSFSEFYRRLAAAAGFASESDKPENK